MASDSEILKNERLLGRFMQEQRKKNISLLQRRYSMSYDDAEDIYQESCIVLFENIRKGKLSTLTSSLSTYFTQICINKVRNSVRDNRYMDSIDDGQYSEERIDELLGTDSTISLTQQIKMERIINDLPEPCNKILWAYYYEDMSMSEISQLVGYNGADTAKAKKSQCMGKLKNRFDKQTIADFYER